MHWPGSVRRTLLFSHSLRARLARSHARSPGARRIAIGAEKLRRLLLQTNWFGKCVCSPEQSRACGILSSRLSTRELGPPRPGLSTGSVTIAVAAASEAPRPGARGSPGTSAAFPPLSDAWQARSSCRAPGSGNGCRCAPLGGRSKRGLQTPSRRLEEVAARIQGLQSRGRSGQGRDAGRSRAFCTERRLAAPGSGCPVPGCPGHPGQTPAGRGRRGGRGGQVSAPL